MVKAWSRFLVEIDAQSVVLIRISSLSLRT